MLASHSRRAGKFKNDLLIILIKDEYIRFEGRNMDMGRYRPTMGGLMTRHVRKKSEPCFKVRTNCGAMSNGLE